MKKSPVKNHSKATIAVASTQTKSANIVAISAKPSVTIDEMTISDDLSITAIDSDASPDTLVAMTEIFKFSEKEEIDQFPRNMPKTNVTAVNSTVNVSLNVFASAYDRFFVSQNNKPVSVNASVVEKQCSLIEEMLITHYAIKLINRRLDNFDFSIEQFYMDVTLTKRQQFNFLNASVGNNSNHFFTSIQNKNEVDISEKITPDLLFTIQNSEGEKYKKICLVGASGIGKTILCAYLFSCWLENFSYWQECTFSVVVWVSLNEILDLNPKKPISIVDFLCDSFEKTNGISAEMVAAFKWYWTHWEKANIPPMLVILDGYDEVAEILPQAGKSSQDRRTHLLKELLALPWVILTTRPQTVWCAQNVYIVEIEGFELKQINHYIDNFFQNYSQKELAGSMKHYLKQDSRLLSSVRIPFHLEILCNLWLKRHSSEDFLPKDFTWTMLFHELTLDLLRRYLNDEEALPSEIFKSCQPILSFFQELAWEGLKQQDLKIKNTLLQATLEKHAKSLTYEQSKEWKDTIKRAGFLKEIKDNAAWINKDAFFLHPSLQAYLAARFFIQRIEVDVRSKDFIAELENLKINHNEETFYWFVAGLLKSRKELLECYLSFLLNSSHELSDQKISNKRIFLLLRCLEEARPENHPFLLKLGPFILTNLLRLPHLKDNKRIKTFHYLKLSPWVVEKTNLLNNLYKIIVDTSHIGRYSALVSWVELSLDSNSLKSCLLELIKSDEDKILCCKAVQLFKRLPDWQQDEVLVEQLILILDDKIDGCLRYEIAGLLGIISPYHSKALSLFIKGCREKQIDKYNAGKRLMNNPAINDYLIEEYLKQNLQEMQFIAMWVLSLSIPLSSRITTYCTERLGQDNESDIHYTAALMILINPNEMNLESSQHKNNKAVSAPSKQHGKNQVLNLFKMQNDKTRLDKPRSAQAACPHYKHNETGYDEIKKQNAIENALNHHLKSDDIILRHSAAVILSQRTDLDEKIIDIFVNHLNEDFPISIRLQSLEILINSDFRRPILFSESILHDIIFKSLQEIEIYPRGIKIIIKLIENRPHELQQHKLYSYKLDLSSSNSVSSSISRAIIALDYTKIFDQTVINELRKLNKKRCSSTEERGLICSCFAALCEFDQSVLEDLFQAAADNERKIFILAYNAIGEFYQCNDEKIGEAVNSVLSKELYSDKRLRLIKNFIACGFLSNIFVSFLLKDMQESQEGTIQKQVLMCLAKLYKFNCYFPTKNVIILFLNEVNEAMDNGDIILNAILKLLNERYSILQDQNEFQEYIIDKLFLIVADVAMDVANSIYNSIWSFYSKSKNDIEKVVWRYFPVEKSEKNKLKLIDNLINNKFYFHPLVNLLLPMLHTDHQQKVLENLAKIIVDGELNYIPEKNVVSLLILRSDKFKLADNSMFNALVYLIKNERVEVVDSIFTFIFKMADEACPEYAIFYGKLLMHSNRREYITDKLKLNLSFKTAVLRSWWQASYLGTYAEDILVTFYGYERQWGKFYTAELFLAGYEQLQVKGFIRMGGLTNLLMVAKKHGFSEIIEQKIKLSENSKEQPDKITTQVSLPNVDKIIGQLDVQKSTVPQISQKYSNDKAVFPAIVINAREKRKKYPQLPIEESSNSDSWAEDFGIQKTLEHYLAKVAHIIAPSLSSVTSPLSLNEQTAMEGIKAYCEQIAGYIDKEGEKHSNGFLHADGGELKKPIVMVINTESAQAKTRTDAKVIGGMHWVTCVIIPKNYVTPLNESLNNSKEKIFFIDSFYENKKFPKKFKEALCEGLIYNGTREPSKEELLKDEHLTPQTEINFYHKIPAAFRDPEFCDCINIPQQLGGSDCGWWAVYNAIMLVFTGTDKFTLQFKERRHATQLRTFFTFLTANHEQDLDPGVFSKAGLSAEIINEIMTLFDHSVERQVYCFR